MTTTIEQHAFHVETKRLLDLMVHSLYTNKEIFLRELISNASDALDRYRWESMIDPAIRDDGTPLEIRIAADPARRTLTIHDNGIGMTRDEAIANIGTIAKSGTHELRAAMNGDRSPEHIADLIGRFGVGFYSAFMVAHRVVLVTARAGTDRATRWESTGDGTYELADAPGAARGTEITLHLRPVDSEAGIEDFTDRWRIAALVARHSNFIQYPIVFEGWRDEPMRDAQGRPLPGEPATTVTENRILNARTPLWTRPARDVSPDEYREFYRHLSHDWEAPLKVLSFHAEGVHEYSALLFLPAKAPYDLYYHAPDVGLRLFSQRVMVLEKTEDLLPRYLRFLRGVVDASDLPLNISRQRLQQDRDIAMLRGWLTKKVLQSFETMQREEPELYVRCWREFGRALKEGVGADVEHTDRLLDLVLFESSHGASALTTLQAYVERMPPGQEHIYYLTGASRAIVEHSPHLESVRDTGHEVLFLVDPVDELLVQHVSEFKGKRLKSIGKGHLRFGSAAQQQEREAQLEDLRQEFSGLLEAIAGQLDAYVKQARLSARLTKTPACLVVEEHEYSPQLERLLHKGRDGGPAQRRVLELNALHPVCRKLLDRFRADAADPDLAPSIDALFATALLAEGSELPDAVRFTRALFDRLHRAL